MESYRELQAERWRRLHPDIVNTDVSGSIIHDVTTSEPQEQLIKHAPKALTPEEEQNISIVAVDTSSMESIKSFIQDAKEYKASRCGVLFGTIAEDGFTVIVDAIYESAQDSVTGESLIDRRIPIVRNISKLMGLQPVGLLVTSSELRASDLVKLLQLENAIIHVLLIITVESSEALIPTVECFNQMKLGNLTPETTLIGRTVAGGLQGETLKRSVPVVKRSVNTIVHTGFYRLNRPNHTPTFNDARAFILARREKAGIKELYLQLADYHLLLWISDSLGESMAERVVIAIHQEDDSLVEDLVDMLLTSDSEL